jgi:hypothetical protein
VRGNWSWARFSQLFHWPRKRLTENRASRIFKREEAKEAKNWTAVFSAVGFSEKVLTVVGAPIYNLAMLLSGPLSTR